MKKWLEVNLQAEDTVAEIRVFDIIGDWIDDIWGFDGVLTAKAFTDELAKLPASVKTIRVRINSPGGDAFGGVTIANALRAERTMKKRKVETIVEGLAASAGSVIAMAGDPVVMADNAMMMVHLPWTVTVGNQLEHEAAIETLRGLRDSLVKTYQWHSDLEDAEIIALLEANNGAGSWLTADQAMTSGLADKKVEGLKAAASIDPRSLKVLKIQVPEEYVELVEGFLARPEPPPTPPAPAPPAPEPASANEVMRLCAEADLEIAFAQALLARGLTSEAATAEVEKERGVRTAARERETEIRAVCQVAKLDSMAARLVASGMSVQDVRAHVTEIRAYRDEAIEIDGTLPPDAGAGPRPKHMTVTEIYDSRRGLLPAGKE